MATIEAVKEQREAASGRKYYDTFITWCEKTNQVPSPALLETWDEVHNDSRIKALLGTRDEIYAAGLRTLYTRFFYSFSMIRVANPSGKGKISVSPYRATKNGGGFCDITSPKLTVAQLTDLRAKAKVIALNAASRMKFLNLTKKEIREICDEAVDEVFEN